jgi:hypothetical protein
MVYRIEELADIAFQDIRIFPPILSGFPASLERPSDCQMRPVLIARRIRIIDEVLVENRRSNAMECLMQYPVAYGRLVDMPPLRIGYVEFFIRIMTIFLGCELIMQSEYILFER